MTNIDKLHEMVKSSLFQFVNNHIKAADLSVVDEIVLNYVIAILEEATEDPSFDVDGMILSFKFQNASGTICVVRILHSNAFITKLTTSNDEFSFQVLLK